MTRKEEIEKNAEERTLEIFGELDDFQDVTDGFIEGANWADKTMIQKASKWIEENIIDYIEADSTRYYVNDKVLIYDFKKAMEE